MQLVVQPASMSVKLFFVLLVVILEFSNVLTGPAVKSNYIEQENSCREVCGLCDCDGFYCEDECICECSIKDEDNLQCIADMKTECDKNGLEYELLMQEATKERFLRQIRPNMMPFEKLSKNLVIIKKKREDSTVKAVAPIEEPTPTEDPHLAAPHLPAINNPALPGLANIDFSNLHLDNLNLGNPIDFGNLDNLNLGNPIDFGNLDFGNLAAPPPLQFPNMENFEPGKLMMSIRDRISTTTPIPPPTARTLPTFPTFPPISFPPITFPSNMQDLIAQPLHTL